MIKIIKVYKDSRILENGTLDTLGLAIKNDNNFDILRFKFDEFVDGVGSLLTTLEDDNNEKVAFPLTKNAEENSYDLVITREIASTNELEFQLLITYEEDVVWHSRIAKLQILNALDVGSGTMPTTIENWLENANLVMSGYENQINQWGEEIEQAVTGAENVNIEVEEGENLYNVTITDRDGNEYQAVIYQGANAVISGATASVDQTIGTPNVLVTMGGTESDRTFDFAFHNLKGEKGDKGDKGDAGAIKMQIVDQLPPTGSDDTIYLVPITPDVTGNNYAEYVYINGQWELLGKIGVQVDLTDYVKNTDYATNSKGGVIKTSAYGLSLNTNGVLTPSSYTYAQYPDLTNYHVISKGTLENVITGKGLVSNIDYASSSTGGVVKVRTDFGTNMTNGFLGAEVKTNTEYTSADNKMIIGKGTLENVLDAKIGDIQTLLDNLNNGGGVQ